MKKIFFSFIFFFLAIPVSPTFGLEEIIDSNQKYCPQTVESLFYNLENVNTIDQNSFVYTITNYISSPENLETEYLNLINEPWYQKFITDCTEEDKTFFQTFPDTPRSVYIDWAIKENIVHGYSDGTFRPENPITRAELIKIVLKSVYTDEELKEMQVRVPNTPSFYDISKDDWYFPYIEMAKAKGMISGYADGSVKPNNFITIGETFALLVKTNNPDKINESIVGQDWAKKYRDIFEKEYGVVPSSQENLFENITRSNALFAIWKSSFHPNNVFSDFFSHKHRLYTRYLLSDVFIELPNSDSKTLHAIGEEADTAKYYGKSYFKDKNNIYVTNYLGPIKIIKNADIESFEVLKHACIPCIMNLGISKDKNHVYIGTRIIEDLESKNTKVNVVFVYPYFTAFMLYDADTIYLDGEKTEIDIDPESFSYFAERRVYQDKNRLYALKGDFIFTPIDMGPYKREFISSFHQEDEKDIMLYNNTIQIYYDTETNSLKPYNE